MVKGYAMLQKKLKELESELNHVFSLPAETPCHQLLSEGIDRRFTFLKNLLSAEIESHPQKPHHLQHIANRLDELETAFHDWDNFRTLMVDHLDTGSTCSCTESCLNDDGNASVDLADSVYEDPEAVVQEGLEEEKLPVVTDKVEAEMKRQDKRHWIGKNGCVGSCVKTLVVVMAMAVIIANFSGCCYYRREMENFLTPT